MEKLIILDFATGEVDIYNTQFEDEKCMAELLNELGHRMNDCQYMISDGQITFHKEVLK